jgi:hypothetical protein
MSRILVVFPPGTKEEGNSMPILKNRFENILFNGETSKIISRKWNIIFEYYLSDREEQLFQILTENKDKMHFLFRDPKQTGRYVVIEGEFELRNIFDKLQAKRFQQRQQSVISGLEYSFGDFLVRLGLIVSGTDTRVVVEGEYLPVSQPFQSVGLLEEFLTDFLGISRNQAPRIPCDVSQLSVTELPPSPTQIQAFQYFTLFKDLLKI